MIAQFFDGTEIDVTASGDGYVLLALGLAAGSRLYDPYEPELMACRGGLTRKNSITLRAGTVQLYNRDGSERIADGQTNSPSISLQINADSSDRSVLNEFIDDLAAAIEKKNGPHWLFDLASGFMARVQPAGINILDRGQGTIENTSVLELPFVMLDARWVSGLIYSEEYPASEDPGESIVSGEVIESTLTVVNDGNFDAAPVITLLARGQPTDIVIRNSNGQYQRLQDLGFQYGARLVIDNRDGTIRLVTATGTVTSSPGALVGGGLIKLEPGENVITVTPDEGAALPTVQWKTVRAYPY